MSDLKRIYGIIFLAFLLFLVLFLAGEFGVTGRFISPPGSNILRGETLYANCRDTSSLAKDYAQLIVEHYGCARYGTEEEFCKTGAYGGKLPNKVTVSFGCSTEEASLFVQTCLFEFHRQCTI